jgi:hypothetical protein
MTSSLTPPNVVEMLIVGNAPSLVEWEELRRSPSASSASLDAIRDGLNVPGPRRWATAVVLARLGADDGDELALAVLREFDWSLIPGPAYELWSQATAHVHDKAASGHWRLDVLGPALSALQHADPAVVFWTDVIDDALGLITLTPDPSAADEVRRVAETHWQDYSRKDAAAMLSELGG